VNVFPDDNSGYRYERKYATGSLTPFAVEHIIKTHPACFSEIFYSRYVNNIYLDTFGLKSYFEKINGSPSSIKTRIRWYGELFGYIANPFLEFKIKRGAMGKKDSFPLGGFTLDEKLSTGGLMDILRGSKLPDDANVCFPCMELSILNRFSRKYFLSADKKFRLTVDSGIEYYRIDSSRNMFLNRVPEGNMTVIEIKYDSKNDDLASGITGGFPFRIFRNSKYINGVENLNLW